MGLSDLFHSLFVLGAVGSYLLPLFEALQRRSTFYTVVFSSVFLLSASLHCEETGICAPFDPKTHERLSMLSGGMSLYLGALMLLVALEIRNEWLGRSLMLLWALFATMRDAHDLKVNGVVTLILGVIIFIGDMAMFRRKLTPAWWRRLALIAAMAALGAALFKLVHSAVYYWHGIWHVYLAGSIYLLLLAQRTKRMLAAKAGGKRGSAGGTGLSSGMVAPLTTPTKRRGGGGVPGASVSVGASAGKMMMGEDDDASGMVGNGAGAHNGHGHAAGAGAEA